MVAIVQKEKEKKVSDLSCPTGHNFESSKMDHKRTTKQSVCNRISSITTCKLQSSPPQVLESKTNKATLKGLTPDTFQWVWHGSPQFIQFKAKVLCSWHHENEIFCGIQAPSLFGSQLCPPCTCYHPSIPRMFSGSFEIS
jgi:hypothetical protein